MRLFVSVTASLLLATSASAQSTFQGDLISIAGRWYERHTDGSLRYCADCTAAINGQATATAEPPLAGCVVQPRACNCANRPMLSRLFRRWR